MRHRATTAELSASEGEVDKAILAERQRILGLARSVRTHVEPGAYSRLRAMIEAGIDLAGPQDDWPMLVDDPEADGKER